MFSCALQWKFLVPLLVLWVILCFEKPFYILNHRINNFPNACISNVSWHTFPILPNIGRMTTCMLVVWKTVDEISACLPGGSAALKSKEWVCSISWAWSSDSLTHQCEREKLCKRTCVVSKSFFCHCCRFFQLVHSKIALLRRIVFSGTLTYFPLRVGGCYWDIQYREYWALTI